MTTDVKEADAMDSRRLLWRVFGLALLCGIAIPWFIWGPLGGIFYVGGLFNSELVYGLGPLLLLLIPAGAIGSLALMIFTINRWSVLSTQGKWWHVAGTIVLSAFAESFVLGVVGCTPSPMDMFMRGLARYVDYRADIVAIQNWLSTLNPDNCEDQPLEVQIAPGAKISDPPEYVPVPPSLARLKHYHNRLDRDNEGRPMIRIFLGGGGLIGHWGITIGHKDMPMPPSDLHIDYYRLASGAYLWLSE